MVKRQYCASAYTIDFENEAVLLVYNEKLEKWLQPGAHIDGFEEPWETAIRETFEETGIRIQIIGPTFDGEYYEPIAEKRYINKVGDMIDIQYVAIPLQKEINSLEGKKAEWVLLHTFDDRNDIDDEIKLKVKTLYQTYLKS